MITKFIEVTDYFNWGKFMLARFTPEEYAYQSAIAYQDSAEGPVFRPMLTNLPRFKGEKWRGSSLIVFDLQTGEGARFNIRNGADPIKALESHKVWVCPMFEPFLQWLYAQDLTDLAALPALVELEGPKEFAGYRRTGE